MSDALSLLRNFVKNKKEFQEEDDKIIFGDVYYPKNVKTNYTIYGSDKDGKSKDYYTLECLAFLIKNRDLQHAMYVKNAGTRNISVVLRPDRRELLSYLNGEVETTASIDKYAPIEIAMQRPLPFNKSTSSSNTNATSGTSSSSSGMHKRSALLNDDAYDQEPMDTSSSSSSKMNKLGDLSYQLMDTNNSLNIDQQTSSSSGQQASLSQTAALKEQFIGRITKKFDETAVQSSRPITENIVPLSESLSVEKIASIKAKKKAQKRTKVSSDVEIDDDLLMPGAQGIATSSQSKKPVDEHGKSKYNFDYTSGSSSNLISGIGMIGADDGDSIMREIIQRERVCRNRFSVLQSSGKQFEKDISAFLQSIKEKQEGAEVNASAINNSQMLLGNLGPLNTINGSNSSSLTSSQQSIAMQKSRSLGYNRFDQERYSAKDETGGFSIDTKLTYQPNGGTITLTPNPNSATPSSNNLDPSTVSSNSTSSTSAAAAAKFNKSATYFQSTQLTQQKTNILAGPGGVGGSSSVSVSGSSVMTGFSSKGRYQSSTSSSLQKRSHSNPIIIIPAARTSLIQMINAIDILQELKFITTDEKRKLLQNQNVYKDSEIINHRKEDGSTVQFKVIDNVTRLTPQDWDRVVAVFAQGAQWQFKDWPLGDGNPVEIFNKVKGFHLKLSGIPLDTNISKWSVTVIELDQHKRHLDRARLLGFWDELDKYMLKSKPHLIA